MVISARRLVMTRWLVVVGLLVVLAGSLRPASKAYLRAHQGTWLASVIELLLPPADLYETVGATRVQAGSPVQIDIQYRYAGVHGVRGRSTHRLAEKVAGHLRCGARSIPLKSGGRVVDRGGTASSLGYYIVEASEVGRPFKCEILLSGPGVEDEVKVEIKRVSGL